MSYQRTIETILNLMSGEQIEVEELFDNQHSREAEIFQLRTKIEKNIQNNTIELVCLYCKQPVAIRGRLGDRLTKHFYFTHPYKSADCIIKTQSRLSEEQVHCIKYNGEKESVLHDRLKRLIGHYLEQDQEIDGIRIDEVYKDRAISDKWRKPDVLVDHRRFGKIAFELQLSTTFLSVIVGRSLFYQQQGIYLIWIFPNFSLQNDLQKFTQKDVFYNNNSNVYVFDKNAQENSERANKLVLTCYYKIYKIEDDEVIGHWEQAKIELQDLHFLEDCQFYYFDSDSDKAALEKKAQQLKKDRIAVEAEEKIQHTIDKIADYLKLFYKKDWLPAEKEEHLADLIRYSVTSEKLDARLKFTGENAHVITKLFFERRKPNFLKFICCTEKILVETRLLIENGRTVFEEILSINDGSQFNQYVAWLFQKGYKLTDYDGQLLEQLYHSHYFNQSEEEKKQIERWGIVSLYVAVTNRILMPDILKISKVLLAISSLKHKMIIGFRYSYMKQVAHYIFDNHADYAKIYLRAVEVYGYYDQLIADDKSGKLRGRFRYLSRSGQQEYVRYDLIIYHLFPELKPLDVI